MERPTFEKELGKYKIVRLADHYKIRWKTQKKTTERPKLMASATSTLSKPISADDDASFWTMIERINVNALSASEMKKFMEAMRLEHAAMANAVNLQDLDYMASKL